MKQIFDPKELEFVGSYGRFSKLNTPITPKENMLRAIRHKDPLWIPMRSDEILFCPRIIPDNIARGWVHEATPYKGPLGGTDMFGIDWVYVESVAGSMEDPSKPHLLHEISEWREKVVFPDIDAWDWEGSARENEAYLQSDRFIVSWIFTGMFERLISFLGFEDSLVSLIDEDTTDDVKELFDALAEFYKRLIGKMKQHYNIDAIFFHDDWGGQKSPFFSVNTCREMIAPSLKKIVDYCHSIDVVFDFHSCGKIDQLVPVMIECGMDKWAGQPINDKITLVKTYGDRILIGTSDSICKSPEDKNLSQEEIEGRVAAYLEQYGANAPEKLFFLQDFYANDKERSAFYAAGRKLLCGS